MKPIPITKPYFTNAESRAVARVLNSGWVTQGPKAEEFEKLFAEYSGSRYAVATNSCATALHLAMIVLKVGPGDEVVMPSFTHVATANAVEEVGARPVFVDIDINTYNISIPELNKLISAQYQPDKKSKGLINRITGNRLKAIMPVHLFGLMADMEPINRLAKKYDFYVIEDAACAHGAEYQGKKAGALGDIGCFSFHPRKIITTGEGGMLTLNDKKLVDKLHELRSHGSSLSDFKQHSKGVCIMSDFSILGYNYRMTDIQAAVGVEQMKKLNGIIKERQKGAAYYNKALKEVKYLKIPVAAPNYKHIYQAYVTVIENNAPVSRNNLMKKLQAKGIATRQGTHAVHDSGYYKNKYKLKRDDFPVSLFAENQTLTLPLYPGLTERQQQRVVDALINTLN